MDLLGKKMGAGFRHSFKFLIKWLKLFNLIVCFKKVNKTHEIIKQKNGCRITTFVKILIKWLNLLGKKIMGLFIL